jgi:peptide-methionine (R)-S-oxide reductase
MNVTRRGLLRFTHRAALALIPASIAGCATQASKGYEIVHTDAEWSKILTPSQYLVLRQRATEPAFSSPLDHEKREGIFDCAGCEQPVFSSKTKFDSGTGWPSFWKPIQNAVLESTDTSMAMERTEVHCSRCGGHLGHMFGDGPKPTGLRYCINGLALIFKPLA